MVNMLALNEVFEFSDKISNGLPTGKILQRKVFSIIFIITSTWGSKLNI